MRRSPQAPASPPTPRSRRSRATPPLLGAALLLPLLGAVADDAAELERIRHELDELRGALARDGSRLGRARERAFALEREMAAAEAERAALAERIARKRAQIEALHSERAALEHALALARRTLGRNAAQRYALATQPRLKLLLNPGEASGLRRRLAYYEYVMRTYDRDLAATRAQLDALAGTEAALKLENNRLRRLRHDSEQAVARLEVMRDEHRALAMAIEQRMAEGGNRIAQLEADERRLLELVERLGSDGGAAPPATPFDGLKGRLAWPADGSVARAPGSALREGGARWAGVLIDSAPGSAVRAVAAGEVVYADWFRNLGQLVIVDHGGGYMTLYGNNAEVHVSTGERVEAGDTIAAVGRGGGEMPAGLYFELRERGTPLDPRNWCARR